MKTIVIAHNYSEISFAAMSYHFAHYFANLGHRVVFISHNPYFSEKQIFKVLKNLNVEFKTQYKFDDCIYKKKLLFDFAIFINDKVKLIEFQGEQHFKEIPYFQSLDNRNTFNEIKIRDEIKQKYAKDNGMNFLTINFNQIDKIEELVTDFIESEF